MDEICHVSDGSSWLPELARSSQSLFGITSLVEKKTKKRQMEKGKGMKITLSLYVLCGNQSHEFPQCNGLQA